MKSEIESGSRPPPFDLKVLKSRPLFFLQVAGGRWPFRAIRGSSLRARLHERRGLQRAVPDLPPLHLRARALSRPSHPPPQLDAIRMRARTLTAFPHATETCLALFLHRFFKPSRPSNPPDASVESLPKLTNFILCVKTKALHVLSTLIGHIYINRVQCYVLISGWI